MLNLQSDLQSSRQQLGIVQETIRRGGVGT
jgi:hypothetical protein